MRRFVLTAITLSLIVISICYIPLASSRNIMSKEDESKWYGIIGFLVLFTVFVLPILILIFVALISAEMEKPKEIIAATRLRPRHLKRYPKDLIIKYQRMYPHNPKGVLEYHISRKIKEGKTREQAIKELEDIGDRSI